MNLDGPLQWAAPAHWKRVVAVDAHTGGEPFRVVVEGGPVIEGATMLERRRVAEERFDDLRRALMWEPRGHADMYGGLLGPPTSPTSHLSVLFMHNDGFSTMCGHGIIALAKVVIETGIIPGLEPETTIRIDTPAGQIEAVATLVDGSVTEVRFRNVPSFVLDLDNEVEVPGVGRVHYDLAFGGAFYAFVEAARLGLTLTPEASPHLIEAGRAIKERVAGSRPIDHPVEEDLGFLYGVIFVGPAEDPVNHSRHVCVFADGEVDRSPTGTGVSGRLAILRARGQIGLGESITIESIVGSSFGGRVVGTIDLEGIEAVIPEVTGTAHIVGRNELLIDPTDTLGAGFLVR
ncbi:MAG TPA: proline racemase family protein [Acidimicrobiia bacterium]